MPANTSLDRSLKLIADDDTKILGLTVGTHSVTPALFIPKADAAKAPELSFPAGVDGRTYLAVALDPDAPFGRLPILGPILHWIQPGLKKAEGGALKSEDPATAAWVQPAPPPPSGPHRYVVMLYEQPADFDPKAFNGGAEVGLMQRVRYSLDEFESKAKSGPAIAVNFFTSK